MAHDVAAYLRHQRAALTQAAPSKRRTCMPMRVKQEHATNQPLRQRRKLGRRIPSTPDDVLSSLPYGTHNWKAVIGALLKLHNAKHSTKDKGVSLKTMADRRRFYFSFFTELRRETRFKVDPRQLRGRHVEVMVGRWVQRGLSTATIHNYLSFLRTFAEWLGKAGMVREPALRGSGLAACPPPPGRNHRQELDGERHRHRGLGRESGADGHVGRAATGAVPSVRLASKGGAALPAA